MDNEINKDLCLEFYTNDKNLEIPEKKRPNGLTPEKYLEFIEAGLELMKLNNVKIIKNTPVPVEFIL